MFISTYNSMEKTKLRIKKEFQGITMSSGNIKKFNTNDITKDLINYYNENGFTHIFEIVCIECDKVKCKCK